MNASFNQAVTHFQKGDLDNAQHLLNAALTEEPLNADAWHLRGIVALSKHQIAEAISSLERANSIKPGDNAIRVNLVAAYNSAGRFNDALKIIGPVLAAPKPTAEAYYQAGLAFRNLRRLAEAADVLEKCIALRRDWPTALEMLADSLTYVGRHDDALRHALRALELEPNRAICHRVVGDAYLRQLRYDEALERYKRAVTLGPADGVSHCNYALLLSRMGFTEASIAEYRLAIQCEPNNKPAWEGFGMESLAAGHFEEGWPHYAGRIKSPGAGWAVRPGPPPATDPLQLKGKPVLAWIDQGIGDQILFSSIIPDLIQTGANLTIECDDRLMPLIARTFPEVAVRPLNDEPTAADNQGFDFQVYVPDAARWFRKSFDDFPRLPGYLKPDPELTAKLRADYVARSNGRPIVGISWRTAVNSKISLNKTIELESWAPILAQPATFVSLQYGDCQSELAYTIEKLGTPIFRDPTVDPVKSIEACAAQIAAMDLVITTSNATAHVAGCLNVPTLTMVPLGFGLMWHWFLEREDSPWYPAMRLLRQTKRNDWRPVIDRAADMVASFIGSRGA